MSNVIRNGFVTPDGAVFNTAAEARDYLRGPAVEKALKQVAMGDLNLAKFLKENEDEILKAFEVGVVARVTKSEKLKLSKALDYLAAMSNPDGKLKFLQENVDAIKESFRWPSVKRLTEEEKAAETLKVLTALSDGNAAKWIAANAEAIKLAYQAGIEKRLPNPKAMEALVRSRDERKAKLLAAQQQAAYDLAHPEEAAARKAAEAEAAAKAAAEQPAQTA